MKITIEADTAATPEQCWAAATTPAAIMQWNAASPDWHCPSAEVDLKVGGRMSSRMEAKDGSMGFDFAATFTAVEAPRRLAYKLDDDRMVELLLEPGAEGTHIRQTFDAETENDPEMQRMGWQSILDSFAQCAASQQV
ncbi:MAG: SRPBCC domain-containing protein [Thermoplasmatota archaeon]